MKFKIDFVTNSSSTCYICCIPTNFIPDDDFILNILEHCSDIDEEFYETSINNFDNFKNNLFADITKLKQHGNDINCCSNNFSHFYILKNLLDKCGFLILSIYPYACGSGVDAIFSMTIESIMSILLEQGEIKIHEIQN